MFPEGYQAREVYCKADNWALSSIQFRLMCLFPPNYQEIIFSSTYHWLDCLTIGREGLAGSVMKGIYGVRLFAQPNLVVVILIEKGHLRVAQVFALFVLRIRLVLL